MDGVLTGLVAALVGGASGYVSAFLTNVIERRRVIDESVRAVRTSRYAELWRKTSLLPKWPRNEGVTYGDLDELSKWFRSWYFGTGPSTGTKQPEPTGPSQTPPRRRRTRAREECTCRHQPARRTVPCRSRSSTWSPGSGMGEMAIDRSHQRIIRLSRTAPPGFERR
jgi:hypothetical protein